MSHPPVTGTSTLGLCRFAVRGSGDHYSVIHRGHRRAISTSRAGVEAIRLLAAGHSVQDTQRVLGRCYGLPAGEIDLAPLVATLFTSGFVRRLDGRPIASVPAPAGSRLWAWLTLLVWSPLLELALAYLPLRLALPLVYRWFARAPSPELEGRVAANLRRAPDLDHAAGDVARIAADHRQALRKQFCDRLLLGSLPPRRARRWLAGQVRVSGLEHLARSAARGNGTILCSFHMGSYGLVPFVLGARGVPVTVYTGFGEEARADVATWLADRARRGDAYPVQLAGGAMGLRVLVRCLERGETVLFYCDRAPGELVPSSGRAAGRISVPFLGTRVWSARGIGWLQGQTGAGVLPVVLLWEGRLRHYLRIEPEITGAGTSGALQQIDVVVRAAYGVLERYVRRDPAQWLKWGDFETMIAR